MAGFAALAAGQARNGGGGQQGGAGAAGVVNSNICAAGIPKEISLNS